jgi:hypothetical protein
MHPDLMERVWNAYWAEDDNTEKSLERVVAVVLEHAAAPELVEALRPFAAVAESDIGIDETDDDQFQPIHHHRAPLITVGDMRRARAALSKALGNGDAS